MGTKGQCWTPHELAGAADALFTALRRGRTRLVAKVDGELSPAKVAILEPLLDSGELPVGRLADTAGLAVPTVTRQLQQLERDGMVARRRDPHDDRRVLVKLTASGRRQLTVVRDTLLEIQVSTYTGLRAGERDELGAAMTRLTELINGTTYEPQSKR